MKKELLKYLVCPVCKSELTSQAEEQSGAEIVSGRMDCCCSARYAVNAGIPDFTIPSGVTTGGACEPQPPSTVESFGFEWKKHPQPYNKEKVRKVVLSQSCLDEDFFVGKLVLDAGCGAGLQTRFMAECGATVIGIDLSDAVESAYGNTRDLSSAHVVKGDLTNLPFLGNTFDFIYSEGVLHHTKDPKKSFRYLTGYIKNGGTIAAGFYDRPERLSIGFIVRNAVRNILALLPQKAVYYICWLSVPLNGIPLLNKLFRRWVILHDAENPGYRQTWCLNYDYYGKHKYQHYLTPREVRELFQEKELCLRNVRGVKLNFYVADVDRPA